MAKAVPRFLKFKLSPRQLREVSNRRIADAEALAATGRNARATGVFYLAGFAIECDLKARLIERYPNVLAVLPEALSASDRRVWQLLFRLHELYEMLERLPELEAAIRSADDRRGTGNLTRLKSICARWTIFARYTPQSMQMSEALEFVRTIKELKPWL